MRIIKEQSEVQSYKVFISLSRVNSLTFILSQKWNWTTNVFCSPPSPYLVYNKQCNIYEQKGLTLPNSDHVITIQHNYLHNIVCSLVFSKALVGLRAKHLVHLSISCMFKHEVYTFLTVEIPIHSKNIWMSMGVKRKHYNVHLLHHLQPQFCICI